MSGFWHDLAGKWGYASGSSAGTVTVPAGACVVQIAVHGSAATSFTLFGGSAITVPSLGDVTVFRFNHTLVQSGNNSTVSGSQSIVFATNTDMYFIEYVLPH